MNLKELKEILNKYSDDLPILIGDPSEQAIVDLSFIIYCSVNGGQSLCFKGIKEEIKEIPIYEPPKA